MGRKHRARSSGLRDDNLSLEVKSIVVVSLLTQCFVYLKKINYMTSSTYIMTTLRTHKSEFSKFGVSIIGLFGSYVRNEQSQKSDIDILVDFDPDKENFDNYMAVCDLMEKLFKNKRIEIVTKNGLSPYIGPMILNEVVYV